MCFAYIIGARYMEYRKIPAQCYIFSHQIEKKTPCSNTGKTWFVM